MTEEVTQAVPTLGVGDLQFALQLIDVCTQRGAFKGGELTNVGQLRDKLAAFVAANTPKQDESEEDNADAVESEG
jgi:hypothetical protein